MASLYVIRGRDVGRNIDLQKERFSLGRDADNDLQLHDTEVSRHHALLQRVEDQYLIEDLDSSNGTYINSIRTSKQILRTGDRLQLGRTLMIYTSNVESGSENGLDSTAHHGVEIVRANSPLEISHMRRSLPSQSDSVVTDQVASSSGNHRSHWEIIYRTSLAVSRTLDIDQLLDHILELIFQWVDCDRGCIMLLDEETGVLQPACRRNRSGRTSESRMSISKTIVDYVIDHSEGVLTSNAREDDRWDAAASILTTGVQEAICVPMQGRYGVVGAIYIDTSNKGALPDQPQQAHFSEDHLKLMVAIGHQAALAIEDTSYYRGMVQAERLAVMGQTIATLSHHIKNILQGIRGGSYLVDDGIAKKDVETISKGWKIVERNQDRIAALVMDMLTFSKDRAPEFVRCDPRLTMDDVVDLIQTKAQEGKAELLWDRPADFPLVDMDAEAIHRAILNVVTNAIDATHSNQGGKVQIRMKVINDSNQIAIIVQDDGCGIPDDQLQKIFSVFHSSKGNRGTGLGLPVSQKILREHGGDITVTSKVGEGTTFTLLWPIRCSGDANPQASHTKNPTLF